MEQKEEKKVAQNKKQDSCNLRVHKETRKMALAELSKINKKAFGRKVKMDALIKVLLGLCNPELIKRLQEDSLSNYDRIEMQYKEHIKKFGPITKDQYFGLMLKTKDDTNGSEKMKPLDEKTST